MRYDDLRLSLFISHLCSRLSSSLQQHREICVQAVTEEKLAGSILIFSPDCVELFRLSIEAVSRNTYPTQLAAQLDHPAARLDLLRFMNDERCQNVTDGEDASAAVPDTDATRSLMTHLQFLNDSKPVDLEAHTRITADVYHSLQTVLMSCHDERLINMLVDMTGGIRAKSLDTVSTITDNDQVALQAKLAFEKAFASTVVRALIQLLAHPKTKPSVQRNLVRVVLELLNSNDTLVATSVFSEIMRQLYQLAKENEGGSQCIACLLALLSISVHKIEPTHTNLTSILMHLAPLSGSKSSLTCQVFSDAVKCTIDAIFERTWRLLLKM
ncbi:hypothetical protein E3P99_02390 [Wallemia hederae]|uniref:Uncharacterized protein n=1 Tax=Wallemia hederae TaxID=1540922 RepID=A0A4T0FM09_9BASI|nr:hypothetical protein E3P99_02390 [Wallemia hederae]